MQQVKESLNKLYEVQEQLVAKKATAKKFVQQQNGLLFKMVLAEDVDGISRLIAEVEQQLVEEG